MASGTTLQKQFVQKRARALATVYLTRRSDVSIHEPEADSGVDFMVTIHPKKKSGLRLFAVRARGIWSEIATGNAPNENAVPTIKKLLKDGPFPFPVVVFFFTMENDQGWYCWASEPLVNDGNADLLAHASVSFQPLDDLAVDNIIMRVDRWYDASFA